MLNTNTSVSFSAAGNFQCLYLISYFNVQCFISILCVCALYLNVSIFISAYFSVSLFFYLLQFTSLSLSFNLSVCLSVYLTIHFDLFSIDSALWSKILLTQNKVDFFSSVFVSLYPFPSVHLCQV